MRLTRGSLASAFSLAFEILATRALRLANRRPALPPLPFTRLTLSVSPWNSMMTSDTALAWSSTASLRCWSSLACRRASLASRAASFGSPAETFLPALPAASIGEAESANVAISEKRMPRPQTAFRAQGRGANQFMRGHYQQVVGQSVNYGADTDLLSH